MDKQTFLKQLNKNLKWLTTKNRKMEVAKYENLDNYDLDPVAEANKIYANYGVNNKIYPEISFKESVSILIDNLQSKDNDKIKNVIFFFIYLFVLLILIKMPFIYVRDIITSFFSEAFSNTNTYTLWSLSIELLYATTTILIFIRLIKNKANKIKNS